MEIVKNQVVRLNEKEYDYRSFRDRLASRTGNQWLEIFKRHNLLLPRKVNIAALRVVLNSKIKDASNLNLSDELLYRLRFYPDFTEYQLVGFLSTLADENLNALYRRYLVELLLDNKDKLELTDAFFTDAFEADTLPMESLRGYVEAIDIACYDYSGEFDGVKIPVLTDALEKSATAQEIRELGSKYGISIPKRLKKEEILSIIIQELKHRGKFTTEVYDKLRRSSIVLLQRFAKENDIPVSVDLMKKDLIAYLFNNLGSTDLYVTARPTEGLELEPHGPFVFDLAYVLNDTDKKNHLAYLKSRQLEEEADEEIKPADLKKLLDEYKNSLNKKEEVVEDVAPIVEETPVVKEDDALSELKKENAEILARLEERDSQISKLSEALENRVNEANTNNDVIASALDSLKLDLAARDRQIADLQDTLSSLKEENTLLASKGSDNSELMNTISVKNQELESLKQELRSLQEAYNEQLANASKRDEASINLVSQLEALKLENNLIKEENTLSKTELSDLSSKFDNQSSFFTSEIREVKELLARQKDKNNYLEAMQKQAESNFRRQLAERDHQIFLLKNGDNSQSALYLNKYNDLSKLLAEKEQEINSLKLASNSNVEQEREKVRDLEMKVRSLESEKNNLQSLMSDQGNSNDLLVQTLQNQLDSLRSTLESKDSELVSLRSERDALSLQNSNNSDLSSLIEAKNAENVQLNAQLLEFTNRLRAKEAELESLRLEHDKLTAENLESADLNAQLLDLNNKLNEKDLELATLRSEKESLSLAHSTNSGELNSLLEAKSAEVDTLNSQVLDLTGKLSLKDSELSLLKAERDQLSVQSAKANDLNNQLLELNNRLNEKDLELATLRSEKESLSLAHSTNSGELNSLLEAKSAEVDTLNSQVLDLTGKLSLKDSELSLLKAERDQLSVQSAKANDLNNQLLELNNRLNEKDLELATLRSEKESLSLAHSTNSSELNSLLDAKSQENSVLNTQISDLSAKLNAKETELLTLNNKLNEVSLENSQKIAELTAQLQNLQLEKDQLQVASKDQENANSLLVNSLNAELQSLKNTLITKDNELHNLRNEKEVLIQENLNKDNLNTIIQEKVSENEQLNTKLTDLSNELSAKDGELLELNNSISNLNTAKDHLALEFETLKQKSQDELNELTLAKDSKIRLLEQEINTLKTIQDLNKSQHHDSSQSLKSLLASKELESRNLRSQILELQTNLSRLDTENKILKATPASNTVALPTDTSSLTALQLEISDLRHKLNLESALNKDLQQKLAEKELTPTPVITNQVQQSGLDSSKLESELAAKDQEIARLKLELELNKTQVQPVPSVPSQPVLPETNLLDAQELVALKQQYEVINNELLNTKSELERLKASSAADQSAYEERLEAAQQNAKRELDKEKAKSDSLETQIERLESQISKLTETDTEEDPQLYDEDKPIIAELHRQLNELMRLEVVYKQRIIDLEALLPGGGHSFGDTSTLGEVDLSSSIKRSSPALQNRGKLENPAEEVLNNRDPEVFGDDTEIVISSSKFGPLQKKDLNNYLTENKDNRHLNFSVKLATDPILNNSLFEDHFILNVPLGDIEVSLDGLTKKQIKEREANIKKAIESGNHQRLTADDWLFLNAQVRLATYEKLLVNRDTSGKKKKKKTKGRINLMQLKEVQALRNEVIRLTEVNQTYKKMIDDITNLTLKSKDSNEIYAEDPFILKTQLEALEHRYLRLYQTNACVKFHKKYSLKASKKKKYSVCKNLNENFCHVFTPEFDVNATARLQTPQFNKKNGFVTFLKVFFFTTLSLVILLFLYGLATFLAAWLYPESRSIIASWPIVSDVINWLFELFKIM